MVASALYQLLRFLFEAILTGRRDQASLHAEEVFRNIEMALRSAGASFADVVKLGIYVTDAACLPALRSVRDQYVDRDHPPASTAIVVAGLVRSEFLVRGRCHRSGRRVIGPVVGTEP